MCIYWAILYKGPIKGHTFDNLPPKCLQPYRDTYIHPPKSNSSTLDSESLKLYPENGYIMLWNGLTSLDPKP